MFAAGGGVSWGSSGRRGYHRLLSGLPGSHPWTMAPPPGSTPSRTGGFLGTTSPGPMAELYGAANQDSGVSSYISAASPAPSTGFGHSLGVSGQSWKTHKLEEAEVLSVCRGRRGLREDGWKETVTKGEQWGSSFNPWARHEAGSGDITQAHCLWPPGG